MISALSSAAPTQPVQPAQSQKPAQTPNSAAQADSVQISSAAKAALQEATETAAQTQKEARGGDRQAQRLLAKEADAQRRYESPRVE